MKTFKIISLFLIISISFSILIVGYRQSVRAEINNPLKIEKIIGLSKTPGTFRNSQGVAVAKDGTIFIADTGESQIEVFDSNYKYLRSFGSIGSGDGQFQYIEQIRFDEDENLYVLDWFLRQFKVFTKDGKLIRKFGEKGDKPDQLISPGDFIILKTGELLVADINHGIKVFNKDGTFIRTFFKDNKYISKDLYYEEIAVDENGYIYLQLFDLDQIKLNYFKFSQDGTFVCNFIKEGSEEKDLTDFLSCMTIEDKYFYLADGASVKKYEIQEDPKKPLQFIETFIKESDDKITKTTILNLSSIVCSKQKIYFLDSSLNRLVIYNDKKEFLGSIDSSIREYGNLYPKNEIPKDILSYPLGMTIGPDNNLYVVNSDLNKISVFDSNWKEINSFGKPVSGEKKAIGDLDDPFDIVFDKYGFCYVSDSTFSNGSIEVFTKDLDPYMSIPFDKGYPFGLAINSLGYLLVCNKDFVEDTIDIFDISKIEEKEITKENSYSVDSNGYDIEDLVIDAQDNIIVSLKYSNEIQWIGPDGDLIQKIGDRDETDTENGILDYPQGLLIDGEDNIYASEPINQRIQKFSPDGKQIWKSDLGWYSLSYMTMDPNGKLYVSDMMHNVILVISDETAIPPVPIGTKPFKTEAEFSFMINKDLIIEEDTFILFVKTDRLEKSSSLDLSIKYPEELISYQSSTLGDLFKGSDFKIINSKNESGILTYSIKSNNAKEINKSGNVLEIQFVANKAGSGKIEFDKITIKNSTDREVLFKNKSDLEFTILSKDKTPPLLKIKQVPESTYESLITIQGETEPDALVTVNKKEISVNTDGTFASIIDLIKGKNIIVITATDKAGNQSEAKINIEYKDRIIIKLLIGSNLIIVKGTPGILDSEPYIDKASGRTMVPLRALTEPIGATVTYVAEDQSIIITVGLIEIHLWIGKPKAIVNGKEVDIDAQKPVSPVIVKGRTFLPLRFIAETFEFKVDWDPKVQSITLTYPNPDKK
jgi:DNA-binding beta-propeller fold protein YncE